MIEGCSGLVWVVILAIVGYIALRSLRERLERMEEELHELHSLVDELKRREPGLAASGEDARQLSTEPPLPSAVESVPDTPEPEPPEGPPLPEAPAEKQLQPPPFEDFDEVAEVREAEPPPPVWGSSEPSSPSWSLSDLEERLGARLPVWIGAAALALAGAFLVKYSLDQGWLGPPVRVGLAVLLGVVLLGAGEWASRFPGTVSQGLSAAGVAVLFSSFLAAVQLYGLLSPAVGFGLMAATTALAVTLSLRRGPMVALIGLLGGLLTPYLIRLEEPRAWTLFGYLLLVEAGVLAVSRRRGWTAIAVASLGGGFLWTILWLAGLGVGAPIWPSMFLLATAVAGVIVTGAGGCRWGPGPWEDRDATLVARLAVAGSLVLLAVLTGVEGFSPTEWTFLGILSAGILVLGRLDSRFEFLPPVAAVAVAVLLVAWIPSLTLSSFYRFGVTAAALTVLFGGGAFLALWGARHPTLWGALSAAAGVGIPLLAFFGAEIVHRELPWGAVFLALASAYSGGAWLLLRRRSPERAGALEAVALAAAVLAVLAAIVELGGRPLTLVLALAVPALVAVSRRLEISSLSALAGFVALLVGVRRLLTREMLAGEISVGGLLLDFGVPIAAFVLAAVILRREPRSQDRRRLARGLEGGSIVLVLAFVVFVLHRIFLPEQRFSEPRDLMHWGALVGGWMLVARGLWEGAARTPLRSIGQGARATTWLALLVLGVGPLLTANPLWGDTAVGGHPIFNVLLWVYGLPLVLSAEMARHLHRRHDLEKLVAALETLATLLAFVLTTLLVLFGLEPGPDWRFPETLGGWGSLLVAWQVLGLILLTLAARWARPRLRTGALLTTSLAAVTVVLGPVLVSNPAWADLPVAGWPVFNVLLWTYGAPALLFAVLARGLRRQAVRRMFYGSFNGLSLVLLFVLVTLEVRQAFHGPLLAVGGASHGEQYAYSAAWIVLSTLLLVTGIVRRVAALRWAALAVMTVTVGKVFLYDTAHLSDLFRVVSYLGLGLSLMLLAWLYQRFVFRSD